VTDRILVTGANGFVGSALCRQLQDEGYLVRGSVRNQAGLPGRTSASKNLEWMVLHDRLTNDETNHALQGMHAVVHLAARVHVMTDHSSDPLHDFRQVNVVWTERLARAAASQGVRRFVYLSSIKVNGEQSVAPFTEQDLANPQDPYGISKWEAEQALVRVSTQTGMQTVIVRSPLVYGPGVGGNFLQLLKILQRGIPVPLASVHNRRSLIYRGNLIDALTRCVRDMRAAGRTYLVSDGEDLSTPGLIRRLGRAMGVTVRLWPFPAPALRWIGQVVGKEGAIERLVGSLQVDSSQIRRELGWSPPYDVNSGLVDTATWFMGQKALMGASV
jgi:UDP-N-acetyl-alpha-D-quinovosamine dehydrogenase